ncbi:MAG: small-conductance mechanosensitive channel [Pirellulaceae bacterium]|jgi:small-conductance mechanosensitive channel
MSLLVSQIVYITTVVLVGGFALIRTLSFLSSSRRQRAKWFERKTLREAVPTSTPVANPGQVAHDQGLESIETHFTVMRRLLVPIILTVTLLLAFLPFVSEASTSLVAAIVAVVAGMALRPFLENAIAGIVIGASRLVRIGDTVRVDGWYGTVEDITTTHTAIKLWDWRRYLVPNNRMLQSPLINYSLIDNYQWAYVEFFVAPHVDIDKVKELAVKVPYRSSRFQNKEEPAFWVIDIEKDAIRCWVAAWANSASEAWGLTSDIRIELIREFRQHEIALSLQRHELSVRKHPTSSHTAQSPNADDSTATPPASVTQAGNNEHFGGPNPQDSRGSSTP